MTDGLKVPGLGDDQLVTLNLLVEQLAAKRRRNLTRSAFYDGRNAIQQISGIIPPTYSNIGLALGWAAKGVDGLARRCTLEKFVWPDGDTDDLGLDVLEDSNFLRSELSQARADSLLHGVSYLVTTKGEAGEPAALVHARDGLNGTGEWSVRKRALTSFLSVTGRDGNDITDFVLYLDGLTITASKSDGGEWKTEDSKHPWGVPVDPLVYRPRSSRRMGKSRITRPVMAHQQSALRSLVRLEAHMDVYTVPKLIMLGADESIFKNADGSPKASWQVALARTFGIPDSDDPQAVNPRVDIKNIPAESPEPHLKNLNALAKLMARETDLPDSDFALTDMVNPTSEGSYVAGRENLIAEAEGAMDDWSMSIRRTVKRALAIQNDLSEVPEEWRSLAPKWRNPLFTSRAAAADAGAKQIASVPWLAETEVGLELLGLDPQQIERATAERRRNAGRAVLTAVAEQAIAS